MTVNGAPYSDYHFKPAAATITYTMEYESESARIYAGVSMQEWDRLPGTRAWTTPEYPRCKADLIMLYRMSNFIPAAASDAQAREAERKSKLRGNR